RAPPASPYARGAGRYFRLPGDPIPAGTPTATPVESEPPGARRRHADVKEKSTSRKAEGGTRDARPGVLIIDQQGKYREFPFSAPEQANLIEDQGIQVP